MEHAGHQHQHQYHLSSAMTKLPAGLTAPGHGCTTALTHRYQIKYLHQPHLALPPAAPAAPEEPTAEAQLERPLKRLKTEHQSSPDAATEATDKRYQHLQRLQTVPDVHQRQHQPQQQQQQQHVVSTRHHQQQQHPQQQQQQTQQTQQTQQQRVNRQSGPRPQVPPASTHVSCLYPEILAMIFSNLDVRSRGRAAQVCTTWRDAAYHKSVWRGVEARLHLKKHATSVFNSLEKRGIKKVQILSLSARRSLYDVFRGIKNLQSLNLSGCYNMTDSGLNSALAKPFPSLTELNLSLCKNITDASLHRIAENLKSLEVLHLGGCGNITNSGLQWLAWGLKRLKRLDLRSCWHISDSGLSYLAGRNPEFGGNLALEHLGLQDCQRLSDEGLKHISEGLAHSLRSINLSFCVLITDSGMKHVARVSSLRELDLRSCDNISEIGISYLVEGGSRISSLDVSFCDKIGDQALQYISQGLFNLKSLSLSACPISDEGISKIAKTQQELETLLIGQCSRLTDKSVVTIVDNMPLLKCIDLYGCTRISKFGLDKIDKLRVSLNLGLWQERR